MKRQKEDDDELHNNYLQVNRMKVIESDIPLEALYNDELDAIKIKERIHN